uniref:Uncharacterized protein n=1 Tax=Triticum urartu TaxID=4572 RepID=A0A8R7P1G1_TRIUA
MLILHDTTTVIRQGRRERAPTIVSKKFDGRSIWRDERHKELIPMCVPH